MKIEATRRHVREAWRGIWRNSWMSFAAVSTVAVALFIFGIFLLLAFNIKSVVQQVDQQVQVKLELAEHTSPEQLAWLQQQLREQPNVASMNFVSKSEAWQRMSKDLLGKSSDRATDLLGANPFPDLIEVKPKDPHKLDQLAESMNSLKTQNPFIKDITSMEDLWEKINKLSFRTHYIVLFFSTLFAVLSSFLIANTIRLTVIARRHEVEIQRLVGASNWFIRWPFFIEGILIGFLGGIVPSILIVFVYKGLLEVLDYNSSWPITLMPVLDISLYVIPAIFLLGILIGMIGSILSLRRFLRV